MSIIAVASRAVRQTMNNSNILSPLPACVRSVGYGPFCNRADGVTQVGAVAGINVQPIMSIQPSPWVRRPVRPGPGVVALVSWCFVRCWFAEPLLDTGRNSLIDSISGIAARTHRASMNIFVVYREPECQRHFLALVRHCGWRAVVAHSRPNIVRVDFGRFAADGCQQKECFTAWCSEHASSRLPSSRPVNTGSQGRDLADVSEHPTTEAEQGWGPDAVDAFLSTATHARLSRVRSGRLTRKARAATTLPFRGAIHQLEPCKARDPPASPPPPRARPTAPSPASLAVAAAAPSPSRRARCRPG